MHLKKLNIQYKYIDKVFCISETQGCSSVFRATWANLTVKSNGSELLKSLFKKEQMSKELQEQFPLQNPTCSPSFTPVPSL